MADYYNSAYTGPQVDEAIGRILSGNSGSDVAAENVSYDNATSEAAETDVQAALDKLYALLNAPKVISYVPIQRGTLVYSGEEQSPEWDYFAAEQLTMSGEMSATNAGTYRATFTPNEGYVWGDGTNAAKTVRWSIGKAESVVRVEMEEVSLSLENQTAAIPCSYIGDGTLSVFVTDGLLADVSTTETEITIEARNAGETTLTVWGSEGTNYAASPPIMVRVFVRIPSSVLEENSPEVIQSVARMGLARNYWNVGDTKTIEVRGIVGSLYINGNYKAYILGFDHNGEIEGKNTIHFQFGKNDNDEEIAFYDAENTGSGGSAGLRMNLSPTNEGGWERSYGRVILCQQFFDALPVEWQKVIGVCTKYSDNTGLAKSADEDARLTITADKIFLLSVVETRGVPSTGTVSGASQEEAVLSKQYDYFINSGTATQGRRVHDGNSLVSWFLRSVRTSSDEGFAWGYGGSPSYVYTADYAGGFTPAFMVA